MSTFFCILLISSYTAFGFEASTIDFLSDDFEYFYKSNSTFDYVLPIFCHVSYVYVFFSTFSIGLFSLSFCYLEAILSLISLISLSSSASYS